MTPLFKKMNLKDQHEIFVLNAPLSFESELAALEGVSIQRSLTEISEIHFALIFVTQQKEIDELIATLVTKAPGDVLLWFAYPKQSSKKYCCDFNRDSGWVTLGEHGFEAVRQVAIDEDWSALRFRRATFIQLLKRDKKRALSEEGKVRTKR